ncbi:MAG: tripartite tricarboxylate transporter substrate binding protein [Betaproteobacteria bacterium]|nr:tripartite tricarboxylate transporter substrate binding protein [Betaproteobacteria bacterium]
MQSRWLKVAAIALLVASSAAAAQTRSASSGGDYPTRPVRLIVPFAPGGNTDVQGRLIAQKLSEAWGQQVVVDNRGGAGGTLGVDRAAKAPPDGYTVVLASFGNILVGPALYKKLPYDPVKDLAPVILVSTPPGLMVVNPAIPAQNVQELIAYARANPGKFNYGSAGNGVWNHLFGELFKTMEKIEMTHVPYKGTGPAVTDLIGGQIQVMMSPFPTAMPHVKSGRLRAIAVTDNKRSPVVPNISTVAESGLPGYAAVSWFALLAPAGPPKPIIMKRNREVNRILSEPDVKAAFVADGSEPVGGTPEDLAKSIREGLAKWGKLVRDLNVQL